MTRLLDTTVLIDLTRGFGIIQLTPAISQQAYDQYCLDKAGVEPLGGQDRAQLRLKPRLQCAN